MALFKMFNKKVRAEDKYFSQRKGDEKREDEPAVLEKYLICRRMINKDLMVELLKTLKNHDTSSTVAVLANTTDNKQQYAAIMLNKGYMPKKIVSYLQGIRIYEIQDAIKIVKTRDPDPDGFYQIDEGTAAKLNIPKNCMLCGMIHHIKREFGVVLVLKNSTKDKAELMKKIRKLVS